MHVTSCMLPIPDTQGVVSSSSRTALVVVLQFSYIPATVCLDHASCALLYNSLFSHHLQILDLVISFPSIKCNHKKC